MTFICDLIATIVGPHIRGVGAIKVHQFVSQDGKKWSSDVKAENNPLNTKIRLGAAFTMTAPVENLRGKKSSSRQGPVINNPGDALPDEFFPQRDRTGSKSLAVPGSKFSPTLFRYLHRLTKIQLSY